MNKFEQIDAMRMGVVYKGRIGMRGFAMEVRPLTIGETISVTNEVNEQLNKMPDSQKLSITESTLIAQKTLVKASTTEPGKNDPTFTEYLAQHCTPDELQCLFNQYLDLCAKVNPNLELMPQAEMNALVEALKKSPSETTKLSRSQLLPLVLHFLSPPTP